MTRTVLGFLLVFAVACSGASPVAPSSTISPSTVSQQVDAVSLSFDGVSRRGATVHVTVRNSGGDVRVGLATYKRIQTTLPLAPSNLALYSDTNVLVRTGETRELVADSVPCGPFQVVVYHTRSSAGTPATKGAPSGYDLAVEHVLSSTTDQWNQWEGCVIR